jgi:hypothetical protein
MWRDGELQMFPPTVVSLQFLEPHATVSEVMAAARQVGVPSVVVPRIVLDAAGRVTGIRRPGEPGYDDIPEPEYVIARPR